MTDFVAESTVFDDFDPENETYYESGFLGRPRVVREIWIQDPIIEYYVSETSGYIIEEWDLDIFRGTPQAQCKMHKSNQV